MDEPIAAVSLRRDAARRMPDHLWRARTAQLRGHEDACVAVRGAQGAVERTQPVDLTRAFAVSRGAPCARLPDRGAADTMARDLSNTHGTGRRSSFPATREAKLRQALQMAPAQAAA
jgi:uncharacterized membrane protein